MICTFRLSFETCTSPWHIANKFTLCKPAWYPPPPELLCNTRSTNGSPMTDAGSSIVKIDRYLFPFLSSPKYAKKSLAVVKLNMFRATWQEKNITKYKN
mmetsp:Transcript_11420/g.16063  ORF Transcript_11420/g.16063 Transcript_11420/m.16063 type:complete len:99 (+) Transcript_11420:677-973(+)